MHLHLDPVGGAAGDMFAAAMLDLHPDWEEALRADLEAAGLGAFIDVRSRPHRDHALTGRRFEVLEHGGHPEHASHRRYREIGELLARATLAPEVRERALDMFAILARAESRVHGVAVDDVSFHEVGEWDSIGDITCAAWLIERTAGATWSCAPLPAGSGRVKTAHGLLAVPAPASALILEGFPVYQDALEGERITPTGAAILRHLDPSFSPMRTPRRLAGTGTGFGTSVFEGISNVLRITAFEEMDDAGEESVAVCQFEVDDQTPEDLAVALERLRDASGVLDVLQSPAFGKKGRLVARVQILARPEHLDGTVERCFLETTTLGVRWQIVRRKVVSRQTETRWVEGRSVRVKRAERPGDAVTSKAEIDDLADLDGGLASRERVRRTAEETDPETRG